MLISLLLLFSFFFFNDTATTEIYTLSLHDALPISQGRRLAGDEEASRSGDEGPPGPRGRLRRATIDRKSTRLNSSHGYISYAVFCLKKKKKTDNKRDDDAQQCDYDAQLLRALNSID